MDADDYSVGLERAEQTSPGRLLACTVRVNSVNLADNTLDVLLGQMLIKNVPVALLGYRAWESAVEDHLAHVAQRLDKHGEETIKDMLAVHNEDSTGEKDVLCQRLAEQLCLETDDEADDDDDDDADDDEVDDLCLEGALSDSGYKSDAAA